MLEGMQMLPLEDQDSPGASAATAARAAQLAHAKRQATGLFIAVVVVFALILLRFFDEDLGFVFRGVVFVLLGLAFLVVNLVLARKKGAAP